MQCLYLLVYKKLFFEYPIIAHAIRAPELPVVELVSAVPLPQSSSSACIMRPRPIIFAFDPRSLIILSVILYRAIPFGSVCKFPKSPTWRFFIPGHP